MTSAAITKTLASLLSYRAVVPCKATEAVEGDSFTRNHYLRCALRGVIAAEMTDKLHWARHTAVDLTERSELNNTAANETIATLLGCDADAFVLTGTRGARQAFRSL